MKTASTPDVTDGVETPNGGSLHPVVSRRRVVVTQLLVNEIVARAKASVWGLSEEAKTSLSLLAYEEANMDALALLLVNGWEAKYDLVSVFCAALRVVEEKAANVELCDRSGKTSNNR